MPSKHWPMIQHRAFNRMLTLGEFSVHLPHMHPDVHSRGLEKVEFQAVKGRIHGVESVRHVNRGGGLLPSFGVRGPRPNAHRTFRSCHKDRKHESKKGALRAAQILPSVPTGARCDF